MLKRFLAAALLLACVPAGASAQTPDTTPPDTQITGPTDAVIYLGLTANVEFAADEPATFECRVDTGAWAACASPYKIHADEFGEHHLFVRGTDTAGNLDATPADVLWRVNGPGLQSKPKVSGSYGAGNELTCGAAKWSAEPSSVSYKWNRNGDFIADGRTYTITAGDLGRQFQCEEYATYDGHGTFRGLSDEFPSFVSQTQPPAPGRICLSSTPLHRFLDDPANDGYYMYTPDLRGAMLSIDERCFFTISTTMRWAELGVVRFYLDSDGNAATGSSPYEGADRMIRFTRSAPGYTAKAVLTTWSPDQNDFVDTRELDVGWDGTLDTATWSAPLGDLGFAPGATAHLRVIAGNVCPVCLDFMPNTDQGWFAFPVTFETPAVTSPPPMAPFVPVPRDRPAAPKPVKPPRVTGSARVGRRLTCSAGTWTGAPALTYVWKRSGMTIEDQTKKTYTVRKADRRRSLKCTVTATNAGGKVSVASKPIRVKS